MPSELPPQLIRALTELGGQRVWSLIVTLFGDLAPDAGSSIGGPALSHIMTTMDVQPAAIRVALHRLRNDGWIVSQKSGRTSLHSLTDHGRAETRQAAPRIYARPDDMPTDWHVAITQDTSAPTERRLHALGYKSVMPQVFVGSDLGYTPADVWLLDGDSIPDWVKSCIAPESLVTEYRNLHVILQRMDASLPVGTELAPRDVAVLRCLIVHNWRRLVLKHPDLPKALYTSAWRGHDCRKLVTELLDRFPKPQGVALEQ